MTAQQNVDHVKADLTNALTDEGGSMHLDENQLMDFAKIGSLLTDTQLCLRYLHKINASLLADVNRLGMRKTRAGFQRKELKKADFAYTSRTDENSTQQKRYRDTKGVLAMFLSNWERDNKFNQGTGEESGGRLPPRTPELTEFVSGADFRNVLLTHGYHWADVAVGNSHGEFTHRFHWYIVTEHNKANNGWLTNDPLTLFKLCGGGASINDKLSAVKLMDRRATVWDQIFDNGKTQFRTNSENFWRCPENLHGYLKSPAALSNANLWVLAQMVDTRARMAGDIGKNVITADYQAFEEAHIEEVLLRGDKTGMGGDTPGTIMWRDMHSYPAFWRRV